MDHFVVRFEDFFQNKTPLSLQEEYDYLSARYNTLVQVAARGGTITDSFSVVNGKLFVVVDPPECKNAVRKALDNAERRGDWVP